MVLTYASYTWREIKLITKQLYRTYFFILFLRTEQHQLQKQINLLDEKRAPEKWSIPTFYSKATWPTIILLVSEIKSAFHRPWEDTGSTGSPPDGPGLMCTSTDWPTPIQNQYKHEGLTHPPKVPLLLIT